MKGLSLLIIFYWKTMIWKWSKKEIFDISLTLWYEKIWSKEPLHCIYDFIIIHRSSLRTVETKPVSFYMLHNLLYEKNSGRCKETFESTCKKHFFYGILSKHAQKKYIISYKTSIGWDTECSVNARTISYCIIFMFYVIFIN